MVSCLSLTALSGPSPIEDEAFLLFLANSVEEGPGLLDPLSMSNKTENHVYTKSVASVNEDKQTRNSNKQEEQNEK